MRGVVSNGCLYSPASSLSCLASREILPARGPPLRGRPIPVQYLISFDVLALALDLTSVNLEFKFFSDYA
jgi:hypothetical protein